MTQNRQSPGQKESLEQIASKIEVAAGVGIVGLGMAGIGLTFYLNLSHPVPSSSAAEIARFGAAFIGNLGSVVAISAGSYMVSNGINRLYNLYVLSKEREKRPKNR